MFLTPYLFPCKPTESAFFAGLWYHITTPRALQASEGIFAFLFQKVCNAPFPAAAPRFLTRRPNCGKIIN
jgi:hypothetical protein